MELKVVKEMNDSRGKIIFLQYGKMQINIVEIKKGYARGGHYHKSDTSHIMISGQVSCLEKNIETNYTRQSIINAPYTIEVKKNTAHVLIAHEDTLFIESFSDSYEDTIYPEYRKIVEDMMKK